MAGTICSVIGSMPLLRATNTDWFYSAPRERLTVSICTRSCWKLNPSALGSQLQYLEEFVSRRLAGAKITEHC